jgi:hypothetical protein
MTKRKRQTIQWPKEKDRQYNDQKKKTDNTMTKWKGTIGQTTIYKYKRRYWIRYEWRVSGIPFIRYAHNQVGKQNNLKVFGSK